MERTDLIDLILRKELHYAAKLVLIVLARKQGTGKYCRVSATFISKATHIPHRTVQFSINYLQAQNEITCRSKRGVLSTDKPRINEVNTYSVVTVNNINRRRLEAQKQTLADINLNRAVS